MSKSGFVYVLTNEHMSVFKLGCTERSVHDRAAELSAPTAVPAPFDVLCYVECEDFQRLEQQMHGWLKDFRVNQAREFFCNDGLPYAVRILYWHPKRRAFTVPVGPKSNPHAPLADLFGAPEEFFSMMDVEDPFSDKQETNESAVEPATAVDAQAMIQEAEA